MCQNEDESKVLSSVYTVREMGVGVERSGSLNITVKRLG
jgi:hypothetical protein